MLNTYLREFVQASIDDWVAFVKSFTLPKYDKGELWKRTTVPFIIINLEKAKETKKKKGSKDGSIQVEYQPSLAECQTFMTQALAKICKSTNDVLTFENDLMTFLELDTKPAFPIGEDFTWVADGLDAIQRMISENIVDPERLL
jgi:hypothetical protein